MEVPARDDVPIVGEHQRIVADGVRLDQQGSGHSLDNIEAGSHHLGLAAQRIGILHTVVILQVAGATGARSEEHTSELQSLMRISYAVFCLTRKNKNTHHTI